MDWQSTAPTPGTSRQPPSEMFSPLHRSSASTSALGKRAAFDAGLDGAPTSSRRDLPRSQMRESNLERQVISLESTAASQARQIEEQRVEIEKLKHDRRVLLEGETKEKEDGNKREIEWNAEKTTLTQQVRELRLKNSTLSNSLSQLESEHHQLSHQHSTLTINTGNEIAALRSRLTEVEHERDDFKGWHRRASALSIALEEEKRKAEEGKRGLEDDIGDRRADEKIRLELKRQSGNLAMLGSQHAALQSEVNDLRQKNKAAEANERAHKEVQRALKDEIRTLQDQLDRAKRDMDSLTQTFPSSSSSSPTSESISTLQHRLSTLSSLHSQTTADLAAKDSELRLLQDRHRQLAESSAMTISELDKAKKEAERELRWAREGRESAEKREQLALKEVEVLSQRGAASTANSSESIGDQAVRLRQLEALVETYKHELEELSRDSRDVEQRLTQGAGLVKLSELEAANERIDQLQKDISALESTISELTSANTTLDAEVSDLMRRVASGEYNPSRERCLELKNNPAAKEFAIRSKTLEDLKAENGALLERLAAIDQGSEGAQGKGVEEGKLVPIESFERIVKEKEEMEKAHAKRLMRLKEIFGQKSREFLESVHSLLGWRIKFDESGTDIRLTSMYAPKGKMGLTLKFASQEGHFGTMQMTGVMAKQLEDVRHFWIVERQSVPGFLAQVTTEMFEKTTIGRAAGYVGLQ